MAKIEEDRRLATARRHVLEAEEKVVEQERLLAELKARGGPTEQASRLLQNFRDILEHARHHLELEEREVGRQSLP